LQRALCPLFDHSKGEGGEGGYPPGMYGRGYGGCLWEGLKETPPCKR